MEAIRSLGKTDTTIYIVFTNSGMIGLPYKEENASSVADAVDCTVMVKVSFEFVKYSGRHFVDLVKYEETLRALRGATHY